MRWAWPNAGFAVSRCRTGNGPPAGTIARAKSSATCSNFKEGDRSGAIQEHAAWIEAQAAQDGDDHIPYRQEAALFANIYWSNRRRYEPEFAQAAKAG